MLQFRIFNLSSHILEYKNVNEQKRSFTKPQNNVTESLNCKVVKLQIKGEYGIFMATLDPEHQSEIHIPGKEKLPLSTGSSN